MSTSRPYERRWRPSDERRTEPAAILLLSGPNLNLLGEREPAIYGTATLDDHVATATASGCGLGLRARAPAEQPRGCRWSTRSTRRAGRAAAIVINAGAFTHSSWALHDALAAFDGPVVELHLSNPVSREPWRHTSVVSPVADALICGLGGAGYRLAIEAVEVLLSPQSGD